MQWFQWVDPLFTLAIGAVSLWALAAMSSTGRSLAWFGMVTLTAIGALSAILPLIDLSFHLTLHPPAVLWVIGLISGSAFNAFFALYSSRIAAAARRTKELEDECAALALRLDPRLPGTAGNPSAP